LARRLWQNTLSSLAAFPLPRLLIARAARSRATTTCRLASCGGCLLMWYCEQTTCLPLRRSLRAFLAASFSHVRICARASTLFAATACGAGATRHGGATPSRSYSGQHNFFRNMRTGAWCGRAAQVVAKARRGRTLYHQQRILKRCPRHSSNVPPRALVEQCSMFSHVINDELPIRRRGRCGRYLLRANKR